MATRLVLLEPHGHLHLEAYKPNKPSPRQIQIRNEATSLNHLDWKRISKNLFINSFPHVLGMDIAGHVIDPGCSTRFNVGDHVIAPGVPGLSESCSYQTHVLVTEDDCAKISQEIPLKAAATLPFCLATAACGLYLCCGLPYRPNATESRETTVLIWGANGSVGKLAIQLAKLSGYTVIAVASVSLRVKEVLARSADIVLSSDDPSVISKINSAAPRLQYALDTVVSPETISEIAQCVSPGGTIVTATKYTGTQPDRLTMSSIFAGEIFGKNTMGQDSPLGKEIGRWLWDNLSSWLEDGHITPLEYEEIGCLSDVERGLKLMETGAAKTKLVVKID